MTAPAEQTIGPRLSEVVDYLLRERAELLGYVENLPPASLGVRPSEGSWSVAETLEHLAKIEGGAGRLVSTLVKQAKAEDKTTQSQTSIIDCLDQYRIEDGIQKFEAPDFVKPAEKLSPAASLESLKASRVKVIEAIHKAEGWDLGRVTFPHPFIGPLTGYQWLLLIGRHEERHLKQIKDAVRRINAA